MQPLFRGLRLVVPDVRKRLHEPGDVTGVGAGAVAPRRHRSGQLAEWGR